MSISSRNEGVAFSQKRNKNASIIEEKEAIKKQCQINFTMFSHFAKETKLAQYPFYLLVRENKKETGQTEVADREKEGRNKKK